MNENTSIKIAVEGGEYVVSRTERFEPNTVVAILRAEADYAEQQSWDKGEDEINRRSLRSLMDQLNVRAAEIERARPE